MNTLKEKYQRILAHYKKALEIIKALKMQEIPCYLKSEEMHRGICWYSEFSIYLGGENLDLRSDISDRLGGIMKHICRCPENANFKYQVIRRFKKRIKWMENRIKEL